jgi:hypothetical protein
MGCDQREKHDGKEPGQPYDRNWSKGVTAKDLQTIKLPEARWVIRHLLPEGLTVLAGKAKIGKSWLALGWSINCSRSEEVLYLALEDHVLRLKGRLAKLLGDEPAPEKLTFFPSASWPRMNSEDDCGLKKLGEWLTDHPGTRLVVIDTLARFRPMSRLGKSSYEEDYAALGAIQELSIKHGVTILTIMHTRKAKAEDIFDEIGGTTGVQGAADTMMVLVRLRKSTSGELHVTGRDIPELTVPLLWHPASCRWSVNTTEKSKGDEAEAESLSKTAQAESWLRKILAGGPILVADLKKRAEQAGHAWITVRRAKDNLGVLPVTIDGKHYWRLPDASQEDEQDEQVSKQEE